LFFAKHQATALFLFYDKNGDGRISYDEFLDAFREDLNPRRKNIVSKVWKMVDFKSTGKISLNEIALFYRPDQVSQEYIQSNVDSEKALGEFWSYFQHDSEGLVSFDEFNKYYVDVSAGVGTDENFMKLLEMTWGVYEDEVRAPETVVNNFVRLFREKLIAKTTGVMDEYIMSELFNSYDLNKSGLMSKTDFSAIAIKLGIEFPENVVDGLFARFPTSRKNFVEFKQFHDYLLYNIYK